MKLSLFDYHLPEKLIAQKPTSPRDHARLLVYNKSQKKLLHDTFINLDKYLTSNDVLVFNNSKVFPARLYGSKETGGKAEVLLLRQLSANSWEALVGTRNPKIGLKLRFKEGLLAVLVKMPSDRERTWIIRFNRTNTQFYSILDKIGQIPLPPYIHSLEKQAKLREQYQTIYASKIGSAAAPTAGLHFTKRLLKKIKDKGCKIEFITLHVGLGTFAPVNTESIEDYHIHQEFVSIDQATIKRLCQYKEQGKRIIAVGTTSVRTLEATLGQNISANKKFNDFVNIFIYPGYKFQFIDAMITNFHLPKSSLLMLISAFIGRNQTLALYQKAIKLKYKFFSFGDAMFLQ